MHRCCEWATSLSCQAQTPKRRQEIGVGVGIGIGIDAFAGWRIVLMDRSNFAAEL